MSHDQRVKDNWALLFAQDNAFTRRMPLVVVLCVVPRFLNATIQQYAFMMKDLEGTFTPRRHELIPILTFFAATMTHR